MTWDITYVYNSSNPPQLCYYYCIFAYIDYWIPHTNPISKHDLSAFPGIFMSQILHSETPVALRFVPGATAAAHVLLTISFIVLYVLLLRAHGMSDMPINSLFMPNALSFSPQKYVKSRCL